MTFSKSFKISLFALSIGGICLVPHAQAGFQWVPAKKEVAPAKPTPVPNVQQQVLQNQAQAPNRAPTPIIPGAVQSPQPASGPINVVPHQNQTADQPVKSEATMKKVSVNKAPPPYSPTPMPQKAAAQTGKLMINPFPRNSDGFQPSEMQKPKAQAASVSRPASAPVQQGDFAVVDGFGADIPLALALRQVVPPAYAYSFGENVNPGYRVSWDGGKPWNTVVNDMLAPLNLQANIIGKTIVIKPATAQPQNVSLKRQNITDPGMGNTIVAASTSAPITPPMKAQKWEAWSGDDLKTTLNAWSKQAGTQVQWQTNQAYRLNNSVTVNAPFGEAVRILKKDGFRDDLRPSIDIQDGGNTIIVRDQAA